MNGDRRRARSALAMALSTAVSLVGCSGGASGATQRSSSSTALSAATGYARIGPLTITGGYIPQPASPDVAAAYLKITNAGDTADTVTRVITNVTKAVMAMNETDHDGVGTMTDLPAVTIPAHGSISLAPGHAHLMLENPTSRLRAGQRVSVTITFAHAGTITLTVPVVPLIAPAVASSCPALTSPGPGSCGTSR